jgi:hypothetical protein
MRRENRDHRVPGRISGLPSGARPAARSRDRAASADRGGGGIAVGAAHGRTDSRGLRLRWRRSRWRSEERETPLKEGPGPSCTALLDQPHGTAEHATQHTNLAVVANTSLPRPLTFAQERGWRRLRLLSPATNTHNRVFHRDQNTTRHFWSSKLFYAPTDSDQDPRHISTLEPLWNLLDLTPRRTSQRLARAAELLTSDDDNGHPGSRFPTRMPWRPAVQSATISVMSLGVSSAGRRGFGRRARAKWDAVELRREGRRELFAGLAHQPLRCTTSSKGRRFKRVPGLSGRSAG